MKALLVRICVAMLLCILTVPAAAGMFKYVNEKGEVAFVDSIDKVPAQFREKTDRMGTGGGTVNVLPDPKIDPSFSGEADGSGRGQDGTGSGGTFVRKKPRVYLRATLYTRPGCGWCTKERDWLNSQGITFVEKNIRKDEMAKKRLLQIVGEEAVPTLEIEGEIVKGFNPAAIEKIVARHTL